MIDIFIRYLTSNLHDDIMLKIEKGKVVLDSHKIYNSKNKVFIAPVTGVYLVSIGNSSSYKTYRAGEEMSIITDYMTYEKGIFRVVENILELKIPLRYMNEELEELIPTGFKLTKMSKLLADDIKNDTDRFIRMPMIT